MTELSERNRLIEMAQVDGMTAKDWADYVLADRKRVVEPIIRANDAFLETKRGNFGKDVGIAFKHCVELSNAIDATLTRSGITTEGEKP